jgi:hypothetical protein
MYVSGHLALSGGHGGGGGAAGCGLGVPRAPGGGLDPGPHLPRAGSRACFPNSGVSVSASLFVEFMR